MGKKLVIKGADFSANGFVYEDVITDASQLYYNNGGTPASLTAEIWANITSGQGYYAAEKNNGTVLVGSGIGSCALAIGECSGYDKVTVKTINSLISQSTFSDGGAAIILFADDNGNVVGGITTMAANRTSPSGKTTGEGNSNDYRMFECNVPEGATKVYSVFKPNSSTISPFDTATKFEMKMIKHVIS